MTDPLLPNVPQQGKKWLKGVAPDDPVSAAARLAVAARLLNVAGYLPLAASGDEESTRSVHQLRVGSRRAAAALSAFQPCLPKRRNRKMGRWLRRIRRAAGAARDLDVLMLRLADAHAPLPDREIGQVMHELAKQRADAQPALIAVAKKLPVARFDRKIGRIEKRIRWRGEGAEPSVSAFGQARMQQVAEEFAVAARAVESDPSIEALHNLRIAAKRLRYTIELFACAAAGDLRRGVYPLVEDLQERLGAMNDHASAERYFRTCAQGAAASGLKGKFNRLANHELQATHESVASFRRWWNPGRLEEIRTGATHAFSPSLVR